MANTATIRTTLINPNYLPFAGRNVYPYTVTIDQADSDLTVRAAATGKRIGVVKFSILVPTSAVITLKSGSNSIIGWPLGANSGVDEGLNGTIHHHTEVGEALVIRSSAILTSTVAEISVIEF